MEEIPVKVAVRVRPLLSKEVLHNHHVCVRIVPDTQQVIIGKDRVFTFDFVFGKTSSQDDVYSSCIRPLLVSLMEGYNATVFTYGQTGSGKTYTIGGGNIASVEDDEQGIIPRAIHELFQYIADNHNAEYTVRVSYIEVYKEELLDLLETETNVKDLHIREDEKGNTVIIGAKEYQVENADEVMSLLEAGSAARHTGSTQMNDRSSRSHAIFTITICQKNPQSSDSAVNSSSNPIQMITSKFHFVDLAGSERVSKTGNTGERFKESVLINSGLLALGNVISALGDPKRKSSYIPFRDAKITRILKDSLGGNAKTLMITCISPSSADFDESLNSLKYANRAKNIKNKPIVNYNPDWDRIDEMESEIKALREALQNHQSSRVSRISQVSQDWNKEITNINLLQEQLAQLQIKYLNHRHCTEEAFSLFHDLKDIYGLTTSQKNRIEDWFHFAECLESEMPIVTGCDKDGSIIEEPHHCTVLQLKRELKKCQDALATDEDIFAKKELELKELQEHIQSLLQENKEYQECIQETEHTKNQLTSRLVEQQLLIDELKKLQTENYRQSSQDNHNEEKLHGEISQRPYSVPLISHFQNLSSSLLHSNTQVEPRKVRTSPPSYSLESMVAGFRTRSQMLLNLIEEQDEVLLQDFPDKNDEELNKSDSENRNKSRFRRSNNRTWTRKRISVDVEEHNLCKNSENTSNSEQFAGATLESLQKSQVVNMEKLKTSDLCLAEANQKMRELTINIKMKEELIKELIKTGQDAQLVNRQYSLKIAQLEREADQAKSELIEAQRQKQELENKELRDHAFKEKLQKDFRKKIEAAKLKMQVIQKKQQDNLKLTTLSTEYKNRVTELELNLETMRKQQAELQKQLRDETEKKRNLEMIIQKDQESIKNKQQSKSQKVKNDGAASRRKKSNPAVSDQLQLKLEEQKKWLDEEVEKVLKERQALTELENDLKKREESIVKMEALLKEKSHLQIKKLRTSQALSSDMLRLSNRLNVVENELKEKNKTLQNGKSEEYKEVSEDVRELQKERDNLLKRRGSLDEKLKNGNVLTPEEEHSLFQLEEGIDALEAAIEYKNECIQSRQQFLTESSQILTQSEAKIIEKFSSLSPSEIRSILVLYFNKVVSLREVERKLQVESAELAMKVTEKENLVRELESSMKHLALQNDRRKIQQQKEHEHKMQLLLHQFKDNDEEPVSDQVTAYRAKLGELEKELFFYKATSRELKKKLKELDGEYKMAISRHNLNGEGIETRAGERTFHPKDLKGTPPLDSNALAGKSKEQLHFRPNTYRIVSNISETEPSFDLPKKKRKGPFSSKLNSEDMDNLYPVNVQTQFITKTEPNKAFRGTPVKMSLQELRQIPASQLLHRRSSVSSLTVDSIEVPRNIKD
ncbi:hypothetical protein GDO86_001476 [Hymenochirus boettgeri]|uniref:Kinesin motor domain-containing protein n=1 Tax=Hymenochirus boettgeri TaxID=247094 RepID=A0A8T2KDT6_9PIPI|nr:hypothetical protein GDO86_001476 [Hymenochirus boettgeri]